MDETNLENVVQSTTDYDKFTFLDTNRELTAGHVQHIKDAFQEIGNMTAVQPILVNEKYEIIDGQHRFMAAQELGEPIYYTMRAGLGVKDARSMNILHRPWHSDDFAHSYADGGDKNYQKFLELRESFGFSHSITLIYIYGSSSAGIFSDFRKGEFYIPDLTKALERLNVLASVREISPVAKYQGFAEALQQVAKAEGYSHHRMLSKLKLNSQMLKRLNGVPENLRLLEDIYNYSVREGNRLRLY